MTWTTRPQMTSLFTNSRVVKRATSGFTLVELLAVMAIMGILLALTVAAFTKIGESASIRSGVNQLRGAIVLARQTAITRRVPTALVILDYDFLDKYGGTGRATWEHLPGRAYAILDLQNRTYIRGWDELPNGVIINDRLNPRDAKYGELGNNIAFLSGNRFASNDRIENWPFPVTPGAIIPDSVLLGIKFLPDGRTVSPIPTPSPYWYHWIVISEGVRDSTGLVYKPGRRSFGLRVSIAGSIKFREFDGN
ncbi:MAG: prepilin-type N-terminal cleavage/methylation domain-containing protein [Lentisphaerae bacterium]|nr:prepilin-type N-terminal cleavage/methylation domain-containing protein [Lentisphaerota bacterium]